MNKLTKQDGKSLDMLNDNMEGLRRGMTKKIFIFIFVVAFRCALCGEKNSYLVIILGSGRGIKKNIGEIV